MGSLRCPLYVTVSTVKAVLLTSDVPGAALPVVPCNPVEASGPTVIGAHKPRPPASCLDLQPYVGLSCPTEQCSREPAILVEENGPTVVFARRDADFTLTRVT